MKKVLFSLLLSPVFLLSQINESDTLKIKANLSLTGFWQGGNVETLIFRAKSDFSFIPFRNYVFKTTNSYVYQEFGKEKADEDFLSLNFLYLNPDRKIYPLILGFASTNFRRKIDLRYLVGGGVTFKVLDKKNHWLKFSISTEYERTQFSEANFNRIDFNGDPTVNTWRGTIWVYGKYELIKGKLVLSHESFYQPSLLQSDNYRWRSDIGLQLPLWKFLDFKISYLNTYESLVIENQKQEDRILSFGFTLKSY
ncbi:MAG: DUF481 domain-containing protein [Muriicola sp.]|nr:DUF481 domain-containing protein [Muriicola sp.]